MWPATNNCFALGKAVDLSYQESQVSDLQWTAWEVGRVCGVSSPAVRYCLIPSASGSASEADQAWIATCG